MNKVKITVEQEIALLHWKHSGVTLNDFINNKGKFTKVFKPLNGFSVEQFSLMLKGCYEVEKTMKPKGE